MSKKQQSSGSKKTNPQHLIIVKADGTDTVAVECVGEIVKKKTKVRLHPDDEYKWETGRDLALNRLLYGTDYHPAEVALVKSRRFNGRFVCVECGTPMRHNGELYKPFKVGKIYTFKDGKTKDEFGLECILGEPWRIIDGIWELMAYKFIPVVE